MASKEQTTVNLTAAAQLIKDDLAPIYGLKNILSAGLVLLSGLDDSKQKQLISKISKEDRNAAAEDEAAAARDAQEPRRKPKKHGGPSGAG